MFDLPRAPLCRFFENSRCFSPPVNQVRRRRRGPICDVLSFLCSYAILASQAAVISGHYSRRQHDYILFVLMLVVYQQEVVGSSYTYTFRIMLIVYNILIKYSIYNNETEHFVNV